jgi:signal transduction histidine kinase
MRRLLGPVGGPIAFFLVAALVFGGLGWVTYSALGVEQAQREAAARAELGANLRVALWRLDGRMLPTLGVEDSRPFYHYVPADPNSAYGAATTPLLAATLPDWMKLHFQLDPEKGWESPQVLDPAVAERVRLAWPELPLRNLGGEREQALTKVKLTCPVQVTCESFASRDQAFAEEPLPPQVPATILTSPPLSDSAAAPAPNAAVDPTSKVAVPNEPPAKPVGAAGGEPAPDAIHVLGYELCLRPDTLGVGNNLKTDNLYAQNAPNSQKKMVEPQAQQQVPANGMFTGRGVRGGQQDLNNDRSRIIDTALKEARQAGDPQYTNPRFPYGPVTQNPGQGMDQKNIGNNSINNSVQLGSGLPGGKGEPPGNTGNTANTTTPTPLPSAGGGSVGPPGLGGGLGGPGGMPAGGGYGAFPATTPLGGGFGGGLGAGPGFGKDYRFLQPKDEVNLRKLSAVDDRALAAVIGEAAKTPKLHAELRNREKAVLDALKQFDHDGDALRARSWFDGLLAEELRRRTTLGREANSGGVPIPGENKDGKAAPDPMGPPQPPVLAENHSVPPAEPTTVAPPPPQIAIHLGSMHPQWITAADGTEILVLVRAVKIDNKTVYQGVVLDWAKLEAALEEGVKDLFPEAKLVPVKDGAVTSPDRAMTSLPIQLDPGPEPPLAPAGWTPLRIGLALAWVAAVIAFAAVGFAGWGLIDLAERRIKFVSAVTHELRTPLTSLRLYLDLLVSGMIQDEAKRQEYLRTLAVESDRLHRLIDNVLDFAKLEKRRKDGDIKPVNVADLLGHLRQTWTDRVAQDGKELVVISTLPPEQVVATDSAMVQQIVGNLIDNARKYTRDAADHRIWVWAKPGGGKSVVIEVEDRGAGVPAAERRTIFKPFRRGEQADSRAGGAGLGLALAKSWAEVLGGKLTYRPADGGTGSCFRLELPAK